MLKLGGYGVPVIGLVVATAGMVQPHAAAAQAQPVPRDTEAEGNPSANDDILVTGQLSREADLGGTLGTRSILDTPLSVSSVSREDLADRAVTALGEVFARDPAVTSLGDTTTIYSSNLSVRGLPLDAANGYKINGLPIYNFGAELPIAFFDRIDLLKGSSGFLYGFSAPGGIVNYVTAKPTDDTRVAVEAGYRSDSIFSGHVDLGGPVVPGFGYRLNAIVEDGDARNGARIRNKGAALSLSADLAPGLRWTFDGIYQKRETGNVVQGVSVSSFTGTALPPPPAGDDPLPVTPGSYFDTDYYLLATGLRIAIAQGWTISADASSSGNRRSFSFDFAYLGNAAGDYTNFVNDSRSRNRFDQGRLLVAGKFATGPLNHNLVLGASAQGYTVFGNVNQVFRATGSSNIYTGAPVPYTSTMFVDPYKSAEVEQQALFASDTVEVMPGLSLLAGVRWTQYRQRGYATTRLRASQYDKSPVTPTLAVLYKPSPTTAFYASYVESLEQAATVSSLYTNRDALLAPLRSRQYEAGFKIDERDWTGSAAVFAVRRGAAYANAANELVQDGYALYRGLDINGRVRPVRGVSLGAGVLVLDAQYEQASPAIVGNRVEGTPNFQLSGDIGYQFAAVPGLSVSADVRRNDDVTINSAATLRTPAYTLVGLGVKYDLALLGHQTTLRANVTNLTDERYWFYIQPSFIFPGEARTLSLGMRFAF
ncbi:TonB-dependent siderophore receptor [Sphingomonas hankookensis]|uniref:TonB-dependent siderophore receptor n=1 Tax=Sphingomonas hankookensis TaxID=563996 RepID=UPI001F59D577|nr:TonB-dependent siderophore receptor [Sphingomonas hankookensis]